MIGYKLYWLTKAKSEAYRNKTKTTTSFSCDEINPIRRTNRTRKGETFSDLVEKVMREQREAKKTLDNHQSNML